MNLDHVFDSKGLPARAASPSPTCLSDELLACHAQGTLGEREREGLLAHALHCRDCHELVSAVAQTVGIHRPAPARLRVVARLLRNGLELLNEAELAIGTLLSPRVPAPLPVRRTAQEGVRDLLVFRGPGSGLDEIEVQVQANGTARLGVRAASLPNLAPDEILSVLLEVDGSPREKRPYNGDLVHFAPLGAGSYRVRVTARAPGAPARDLAEATLELKT
jgi:hypothetical protein